MANPEAAAIESERLQRVISERLKALREEKGWRIELVAGLAGISKTVVIHMEAGKTRFYFDTAARIAFALGTSLHAILEGA